MRLSVVTISFNQGRYLEACIKSVFEQGYPELEYIVVDPGSTDESRGIIERYADRLSRVILEPDRGPADGLNKGFRYATGDIFCYLNADDVFLPGAFERIAREFSIRAKTDVLCGNGYQIDENGRRAKRIFSTRWGLRRYAYGACNAVQQATFFRCASFRNAGGFNIENRTCWDGELLVDMALKGARFGCVPVFLGAFRLHGGSITGTGRLWRDYQRENRRVRQKAIGRPPAFYDPLLAPLYRADRVLRYPLHAVQKILDRFTGAGPPT